MSTAFAPPTPGDPMHLRAGIGAPAARRAAAERFRGFFEELSRTFVEREDLLTQIALALLSREHVLMTGPPGTAKSGIAAAVLGRIVDERTGKPSVFARQFTESTVQTDLVGPIDFKTLMATGRTEHFTDEGMLGAVHAFLDEVLDGRDMLLRTTLNVLHERELKQGTRTTTGQIECALMTTNRYLAEVLEGSRETLLAFVDRIAFVSFVPKSFADPASLGRVVRSNVGGLRAQPKALLTIQDLDVLQAAADEVPVPDEICDALCVLCGHLDADLAAAAKHDPTFVPTRYLSTRTTVRLARILRAACIYDGIMRDEGRSQEVVHEDLAFLRLSLLLSGPEKGGMGRLLEKESDPRERRQLSILRTEREIFDRALARVPRSSAKGPSKARADVVALEREVERAVPAAAVAPLLETATKLAQVTDAGGPGSMAAAELLSTTLSHLAERAVRLGTTAGAGPQGEALEVVDELASLADGLERTSGTTRPVARWLRGRALRILLDAATLAPARIGPALDRPNPDALLAEAELVFERCAALLAAGADPPAGHEEATRRAVERVEAELADAWDAGFRESVKEALGAAGAASLDALLEALGPALAAIDAAGARLAKLGARADGLKARVVAPRLEPLVAAAFARVNAAERAELVEQVKGLVEQLAARGLRSVLSPGAVLRFAVAALVRSEEGRAAPPPAAAARDDFAAYRALRATEQRVSLAYTTVELAAGIATERPSPTESAEELTAGLTAFVEALPAELRDRVVDLDLARIERAVALLERWWAASPKTLEALAESRFFHVTREEGALLRFALECRVLGDVFASARDRASAVRARIDALETTSSGVLSELRRGRADAAWTELLG